MNLPEKYQWLSAVKGLPLTIKLGLQELGVKEVVGKGSNKTIIGWRDELNLAGSPIMGFSDDDIPWCGLFAAVIVYRRQKNAEEVVESPLWARNWMKYGRQSFRPGLGDILVFSRGSGGHVGFYIAEDATAYHVLGGNQSNKVSIVRISKNRLLAARRPTYRVQPRGARPYIVASTGSLSIDES